MKSEKRLKQLGVQAIYLFGSRVRFHVVRYGRVLLDADTKARLDFEAQTMLLYCDYRPILDEFDNAILKNIGFSGK